MKKNHFLIALLVFVVLCVMAFFVGLNLSVRAFKYSKPIESNSWLLLNAAGIIQDYDEIEYGFMGQALSVEEISSKIKYAAFDKNIKGIFISPMFTQISMAGINEISEAIRLFKQSGKPVLAHLSMQNQRDYILAALADTIAMEPAKSAGLFMDGVQANLTFYKNLLDKLGLKIHVIQSGEFKGAGEALSRTELSPEAYASIKEVLSDRYKLLIDFISEKRKLTPEKVRSVFELRPDFIISSAYAKETGLIDIVMSKDDFMRRNNIHKKRLLAIKDYSVRDSDDFAKPKIALCYLQGGISPKIASLYPEGINAEKVQDIIDHVVEDKSIKAVVLRINSPGGSALESEIILRKLEHLKTLVPVVVSMSGVAASGGYYISAPADYIVADPFTITGSIGVVQLLPDASGLAEKAGITNQSISFGKFAGAFNFMTPPSSELLASLRRNSENVYLEFKDRVGKHRKISPDSLKKIAAGRIWSADDALANRLIDEVGGLETALEKAAELAKVKSYETIVLPRKKSYWDVLFEQLYDGRFTKLNLKPESIKAIILEQLKDIFRPYSVLCIMPYELD